MSVACDACFSLSWHVMIGPCRPSCWVALAHRNVPTRIRTCPISRGAQLHSECPIIYQDGQPVKWYFTSIKEDKMLKKKRRHLNSNCIFDAFTSKKDFDNLSCEACAVSMKESPYQPAETVYEENLGKTPVMMQWLTQPELKEQLFPPEAESLLRLHTPPQQPRETHVLQRFVASRGSRDAVIRVAWSSEGVHVEQMTSRAEVGNRKVDLNKRLVRFNTPGNLYEPSLVNGQPLAGLLNEIASGISQHVYEVTEGKLNILYQVLYFKLDVHHRLWFMHCSSMRMGVPGLYNWRYPAQRPPYIIALESGDEEYGEKEMCECVITGEQFPEDEKCEVSFKSLILHWDCEVSKIEDSIHRLHCAQMVPPAIQHAMPHLTSPQYQSQRNAPDFLYRTMYVSTQAGQILESLLGQELEKGGGPQQICELAGSCTKGLPDAALPSTPAPMPRTAVSHLFKSRRRSSCTHSVLYAAR